MYNCLVAFRLAAKNHNRQSTRLGVTNGFDFNARAAKSVDQNAQAAARNRAAARAAREQENQSRINALVSESESTFDL